MTAVLQRGVDAFRYIEEKKYPIRDWGVWNEPDGGYEDEDLSPFFQGTPADYAGIYTATYRAAKARFASRVRVGLALGNNEFSTLVLKDLQQENVGVDFVDVHVYADDPAALPYRVWAKDSGGVEGMLVAHGFAATTPITLGEWSRSIPRYATDGPGAAFLACGLIHMNAMTATNSGGKHNVERGFVYSASKVWDGLSPTDHNAAVVWNTWGDLVNKNSAMVEVAGTKLDGHLQAVAGMSDPRRVLDPAEHSVVVVYAHYEQSMSRGRGEKEKTLPRRAVKVEINNLPWANWTWTQADNTAPAELVPAAAGTGGGPSGFLTLMVHGNSFGTLVIRPADGAAATAPNPATSTPVESITTAAPGEACDDLNPRCADWAARGLCLNPAHADNMQRECRTSCGVAACGTDATAGATGATGTTRPAGSQRTTERPAAITPQHTQSPPTDAPTPPTSPIAGQATALPDDATRTAPDFRAPPATQPAPGAGGASDGTAAADDGMQRGSTPSPASASLAGNSSGTDGNVDHGTHTALANPTSRANAAPTVSTLPGGVSGAASDGSSGSDGVAIGVGVAVAVVTVALLLVVGRAFLIRRCVLFMSISCQCTTARASSRRPNAAQAGAVWRRAAAACVAALLAPTARQPRGA